MSLLTRTLHASAKVASLTWPVAGRIFREKLEIDENRSVWAASTPDYRPGPPLTGDISADLAIIGGASPAHPPPITSAAAIRRSG